MRGKPFTGLATCTSSATDLPEETAETITLTGGQSMTTMETAADGSTVTNTYRTDQSDQGN
ncbi:hypothetical protein [Streptomyces sp. NPDC051662]|uniref:hypothetical protein n=1 Tax=Streptomyces sp. NPDC051662 TaxID=3154750 RepID=UPI00342953FF